MNSTQSYWEMWLCLLWVMFLLNLPGLFCIVWAKKHFLIWACNTVQRSSCSSPTRLVWVYRQRCVCWCVCVDILLACCHLLCLVPPLPSAVLFSAYVPLSLRRHRKSTVERAIPTQRNRVRERERGAGWSRVACHASAPSVNLPPLSSWQAAGRPPKPCVQAGKPH